MFYHHIFILFLKFFLPFFFFFGDTITYHFYILPYSFNLFILQILMLYHFVCIYSHVFSLCTLRKYGDEARDSFSLFGYLIQIYLRRNLLEGSNEKLSLLDKEHLWAFSFKSPPPQTNKQSCKQISKARVEKHNQ